MYEYRDIAGRPATVLTTADETIAAVAAICRESNAKAWLFGSQARGRGRSGSDIDVAVRGGNFDLIEEQVCGLDTVYRIDLVDLECPHEKGIEDAWISIA